MHKTIAAAALFSLITAVPLWSAPVSAQEKEKKSQHTAADIKNAKPSGTVEIDAEQVRLLIGGARGKGVLTYQGKTYPFTMRGVSAGGVGINKVHATGNVYFLDKVEDFPGTYSAITAGVTVGAGKGASQFENNKGVLVSLRSKSEGVALTLGIGAAEVEFVK